MDTHAQVPANQYGLNTPTKRSSSSGVWNEVKRLRGSLNNEDKDGTHICLVELKSGGVPGAPPKFCNQILKLHKSKATIQSGSQSWLTTRAAEHLAKVKGAPEGQRHRLEVCKRGQAEAG